jgi:hypothetical protein
MITVIVLSRITQIFSILSPEIRDQSQEIFYQISRFVAVGGWQVCIWYQGCKIFLYYFFLQYIFLYYYKKIFVLDQISSHIYIIFI